jgi:hypothetical protein
MNITAVDPQNSPSFAHSAAENPSAADNQVTAQSGFTADNRADKQTASVSDAAEGLLRAKHQDLPNNSQKDGRRRSIR